MTQRVVAVDGPAGAGKSTVSRRLARVLGFRYVDSGAMYRVIGVLAAERGVEFTDSEALAALCDETRIEFEDRNGVLLTLVGDRDLTRLIRTSEAGQFASRVSVVPAVRERLVVKQRAMGGEGSLVMEGRDIGTAVFPDAAVKIYLTASAEERARRRCAELAEHGGAVDPGEVADEIADRDRRDRSRTHSPLRPAADAIVIDTTGEDVDLVVARLRAVVERAWTA
jgi:cytidylate kinase